MTGGGDKKRNNTGAPVDAGGAGWSIALMNGFNINCRSHTAEMCAQPRGGGGISVVVVVVDSTPIRTPPKWSSG